MDFGAAHWKVGIVGAAILAWVPCALAAGGSPAGEADGMVLLTPDVGPGASGAGEGVLAGMLEPGTDLPTAIGEAEENGALLPGGPGLTKTLHGEPGLNGVESQSENGIGGYDGGMVGLSRSLPAPGVLALAGAAGVVLLRRRR